jgi:hypothetical protein
MGEKEMTGAVDDRTLVQLLFNKLGEEERVRLEERIFGHEDLFERLCALEDELVRDYLRRELSPDQMVDFEARMAVSASLRQHVENARALMSALAAGATKASAADLPAAGRKSSRNWFTMLTEPFKTQVWVYVAILAVAAAGWLAADNQRLRTRLVETAQQTDRGASRVSYLLSPGASLGAAAGPNRLHIPSQSATVHLDLDVRTSVATYRQYRAELRQVDADTQFWAGAAEAHLLSATVSVEPPAMVLAEGDYILRLYGLKPDGQWEDLPSYAFGVVRK